MQQKIVKGTQLTNGWLKTFYGGGKLILDTDQIDDEGEVVRIALTTDEILSMISNYDLVVVKPKNDKRYTYWSIEDYLEPQEELG